MMHEHNFFFIVGTNICHTVCVWGGGILTFLKEREREREREREGVGVVDGRGINQAIIVLVNLLRAILLAKTYVA